MNKSTTSCQICEREIKSKSGVIAHHGYQRPWQKGYQTASCFGARQLPYEQSCSAMAPYIEMVGNFKKQRESYLANLLANPPEKLTEIVYGFGKEAKEIERPEDFEYASTRYDVRKSMPRTYENSYGKLVYTAKSDIGHAEKEIERVSKRLAAWEPAPLKDYMACKKCGDEVPKRASGICEQCVAEQ